MAYLNEKHIPLIEKVLEKLCKTVFIQENDILIICDNEQNMAAIVIAALLEAGAIKKSKYYPKTYDKLEKADILLSSKHFSNFWEHESKKVIQRNEEVEALKKQAKYAKYAKPAFWTSVIALIISVIALIKSLLTN